MASAVQYASLTRLRHLIVALSQDMSRVPPFSALKLLRFQADSLGCSDRDWKQRCKLKQTIQDEGSHRCVGSMSCSAAGC